MRISSASKPRPVLGPPAVAVAPPAPPVDDGARPIGSTVGAVATPEPAPDAPPDVPIRLAAWPTGRAAAGARPRSAAAVVLGSARDPHAASTTANAIVHVPRPETLIIAIPRVSRWLSRLRLERRRGVLDARAL